MEELTFLETEFIYNDKKQDFKNMEWNEEDGSLNEEESFWLLKETVKKEERRSMA